MKMMILLINSKLKIFWKRRSRKMSREIKIYLKENSQMSLSKFNKMKRIEIFKIHFLNVTKSTIKNNTVLMICK